MAASRCHPATDRLTARAKARGRAPENRPDGDVLVLPRLHRTLQRLEVLPELPVGRPLLKWLQQLEEATRLNVYGPRVTRGLGRLFKGRMPLMVRDWSTARSV